jgi:hypothetical protein
VRERFEIVKRCKFDGLDRVLYLLCKAPSA